MLGYFAKKYHLLSFRFLKILIGKKGLFDERGGNFSAIQGCLNEGSFERVKKHDRGNFGFEVAYFALQSNIILRGGWLGAGFV